jgi:protein phosphatase
MGGHEAGEVASQVASERLVEVIAASSPDNPPRALYQAFVEANQAVIGAVSTRGAEGMGTTGVAAWVLGSRCYVGWVGDSRLYQFRAGALIERTRDHTRVAQMVSNGILTEEEARHHPEAHVLVMALGGSPGVQRFFKPEVWTDPLELRSGDVLLLCSDGLYDLIEDHELYPLIEGRDYQDAVERLIQTANERGGTDNISVILLVAGQPEVPRVAGGPQAPRRETLPEGLPMLAPVSPVRPESEVRATRVPEPRRVEHVAPAVPAAPSSSVPMGRTGRRVPLWWLLATGLVALGVGIGLGLRASSAPPEPSRGSSTVAGVDAGSEAPSGMGTPHPRVREK